MTVLEFVLIAKSKISLNGPFVFLSSKIDCTADPPVPLTAPIPNKISPDLLQIKSFPDWLISGPNTLILAFL